jgi:hypothetical protein
MQFARQKRRAGVRRFRVLTRVDLLRLAPGAGGRVTVAGDRTEISSLVRVRDWLAFVFALHWCACNRSLLRSRPTCHRAPHARAHSVAVDAGAIGVSFPPPIRGRHASVFDGVTE